MITEKMLNGLPALLTVKEMALFLNIGLGAAYQIIYKKHFPVLRIAAKSIRVPKCEMTKWIRSGKSRFKFSDE